MTFQEALEALKNGKKVKHRRELMPIHVQEIEGKDKLVVPGKIGSTEYVVPVAFDWSDIMATDWEVVDE